MTRPRNDKRSARRKPLDPARRAAFDVLRAVAEQDAYANLALPALLRDRGITGRDAAFATELTYGTCRTRGLLDAVIEAAAGRPPDRIDPVLLDLLRLGTYQLLRTRVEQHAAVSTTVEQAGIEFDSARAGARRGHRSRRPRGVRACASPVDRPGVRRRARSRGRTAGRAAGQRRRATFGASGRAARCADRRTVGRTGGRHRGPLLAVCGVPVRRRSG